MSKKNFRVVWVIDVTADDEVEAAREAKQIMDEPIAWQFYVAPEAGPPQLQAALATMADVDLELVGE